MGARSPRAAPAPVPPTPPCSTSRAPAPGAPTPVTPSPSSVDLKAVPARVASTVAGPPRVPPPRRRHGVVHAADQLEALPCSLGGEGVEHPVHDRARIERRLLEDQLRRLDAGEVEDVVHDREEALGAGPRPLQEL